MKRDDLTSLADVQRLLLPDHPSIAGLEYAVHYQPAEVAAGDYYDLMALTHHAPDSFDRASLPDVWGLMIGVGALLQNIYRGAIVFSVVLVLFGLWALVLLSFQRRPNNK